ncbi:MAG: hypothetical protein QXX20_04770 [Candidatus Thermoplasmatota archaeon]
MKTKNIIIISIMLMTLVIPTNIALGDIIKYPDELDQECSIFDNIGLSPLNNSAVAQSFVPTMNILTRVRLLLFDNGAPQNSLKVSIRSSLSGLDLTSTIVQPGDLNEPTWITFDFNDIQVEPLKTYYIVFKPIGAVDINNLYAWGMNNANGYTYGSIFTSHNDYLGKKGWISEFLNKDLCFQTYGRMQYSTT